MSGSFSAPLHRGLYLYVLFVTNLVALVVTTLLFVSLGRLGDTIVGGATAGAGSGRMVTLSLAFLATGLAFAAAWKSWREEPTIGALAVVVLAQALAAGVLHGWSSVVPAFPCAAALWGLATARTTEGLTGVRAISDTFKPQPQPPQPQPFPSQPAPGYYPPAGTTPPAQVALEPQAAAPQSGPATPAAAAPAAAPVASQSAPEAPPTTCPRCGGPRTAQDRFCASCGSPLS